MNLLDDIKTRLYPFKKLYDYIRIIDPIKNTIINTSSNDNAIIESNFSCYKFWERNEMCTDCTSIKSYIEDDTFFKIELKNDEIYLVVSTPFKIEDKTFIVELIKNISKNSFYKDDSYNNSIHDLVHNFDNILSTDELTKIYNKKFIYEQLEKSLNSNIPSDYPLTFMMIDIDFFKNINDTYGHVVGDKVLTDFVSILSSSLKDIDVLLGRFGGDEFLLLFKSISLDKINTLGKSIVKSMEDYKFNYNDISIKLTCSLGSYTIFDNTISVEDLVKASDHNLYLAKEQGRNKMVSSFKK
ncbi:MAG: GGDEF domain-containing protein [Clostridium sp.]|uniref:GGDEF domain-containing protein n=1 Tax=Clostridium sp. TaxID=1506 RepID=UPI003F2C1409